MSTVTSYFQLGLFERMPPAQLHSATSVAAASAALPKAATQRGFVLAYIRGTGKTGATDEEIQDALHLSGNTERPRRNELLHPPFGNPLISDSNMTRATRAGRQATVWVAI